MAVFLSSAGALEVAPSTVSCLRLRLAGVQAGSRTVRPRARTTTRTGRSGPRVHMPVESVWTSFKDVIMKWNHCSNAAICRMSLLCHDDGLPAAAFARVKSVQLVCFIEVANRRVGADSGVRTP